MRDSAAGETLSPAQLEELPINYTIPFDWGSFKVTEAANQAYQFTPLRQGVQRGNVDVDSEASSYRVNIRLLAPSEIPSSPFGRDDGHLFGHVAYSNDGINMTLGFRQSRTESIDHLMEMFQEVTGATEEQLEEILDDETEESMAEHLQEQAPQLMVHTMCAMIENMTANAFDAKLSEESDRKLRRAVAGKSLGGVAIGGLLVVAGSPDVFWESLGGFYALLGVTGGQRELKQYLRNAPDRRERIEEASSQLAEAVTSEIHETFCTAHFDAEMNQLFENS
jgi:hypothetical protein